MESAVPHIAEPGAVQAGIAAPSVTQGWVGGGVLAGSGWFWDSDDCDRRPSWVWESSFAEDALTWG